MRAWIMAAAVVAGTCASAAEARSTYDATITRTDYNIPHISSDTWQGVGYGVAYAYAQDNVCMMAEEFVTVAGERSLHFGPETPSQLGLGQADNLTSDIFYRSQIDLEPLRAGWSDQSIAAQQVVDGYIKGYNRYLRDTGMDGLPEACRNAAWVRPISRDDMLRLNEKQMLLASSLALAPGIATAAPPGGDAQASAAPIHWPSDDDRQYGSNGWGFGGDVTVDGRGLLIGNPHFPWTGPSRFWQLHVTGPDGYDVMGVGLAGTPIPTLGFNKDVAWTHTVTAARHFTIYMLTLSPDDPTVYLVDGEPVEMEELTVSVPMPDGAEPVTRTLYTTQFGRVVTIPGTPLGWNNQMAFALRDANSGNQRAIDVWLKIGSASNVGEIEAAVSETLGIPWVNTIAADRNGDALHADITAVPNVSAEFAQSCATPVSGLVANRVTLLDGTRAECDWRVASDDALASLLPASEQATRTRRDYVTNSNDSYWISNPREPYQQLSPILGDHEKALSLRSRSNFIETEAALDQGKIHRGVAKELVFDNHSLAADLTVDPMLALCTDAEGLAEACDALRGWDRQFEVDSRGAYLFAKFWDTIRNQSDLWQVPFDAGDPVNTPRDFATADAAGTKLLEALGEAAAELEEAGIALDARWGDVLTQRLPDGDRIAIHGGPGVAGVLNMQIGREVEGGMVPRHGSSYIQIVGFDADGPVADAILSYSQSTNPATPHYSDQTRLYSAKSWHRLPFSAEEVAAAQQGETLRIAE